MGIQNKKQTKRKKTRPQKIKAPRQQLSAPEVFFRRLNAHLKAIGLDPATLDTKTDLNNPPPCFALRGASYDEWLTQAVHAEPPLRVDMPMEVNYCRDCTARFRKTAIRAGACLFPHMRLEKQAELGEKLFVGVTHSRLIGPGESGLDPALALPDPGA